MKKIITAIAFAAALALPLSLTAATLPSVGSFAQASEDASTHSRCQWINGYYRKDGTYVQGHWRGC